MATLPHITPDKSTPQPRQQKLWPEKTGNDLWVFVIALTFPLYAVLALVMIAILAVGK